MTRHNRRDFLRRAALGTAAAYTLSSAKSYARAAGANERVRLAMVGINSRGMEHIHNYCALKNVEIVYLVDPDSRLYASRSNYIEDHKGGKPKCLADLRVALEDKNIDAVSVAAPNHWHSLLGIWACQAGKDVYMEKPCSHNIFEGRKLVEAARKYDRIVQHGTQSRSDPAWIAAVAAVRGGRYGKLLAAYGWASKPRRSIGFRWPKTPPAELNYDLWLGPAPGQPYHENLVHYNWHWFWDFGNGEIGNQGVHQMDIARWAMPDGATPKSILSLGGRYGYFPQDQGQTPNVQLTIIDFGGPKIIFEDCGLVEQPTAKVANEFLTDEGVIKNGKFYPKGKTEGVPLEGADGAGENQVDLSGRPLKELRGQDPARLHIANFIDCVRNRRREQLNAEIAEGHSSSALSHLANLSYRLGKEVSYKNAKKAVETDANLSESFQGLSTHLAKATGLDLNKLAVRMGRSVKFDAAAERFIDDAEADALLTRPYRAPYTVPEQV